MAWSIRESAYHAWGTEFGSLKKSDVWLHFLTYTLFFTLTYHTQSLGKDSRVRAQRQTCSKTKKSKEIGRLPEESIIMRQENPWSLLGSQPSQINELRAQWELLLQGLRVTEYNTTRSWPRASTCTFTHMHTLTLTST